MTVDLETSRVSQLSRKVLSLSVESVEPVSHGHWSVRLRLERMLFEIAVYGGRIYVSLVEPTDSIIDHLASRIAMHVIEINRERIFQLINEYATDHAKID